MFIVKDFNGVAMYDRDFNKDYDDCADLFNSVMAAHEAVEEYLYNYHIDEMRIMIIDLDALTKSCYTVRHSFQWEPIQEGE